MRAIAHSAPALQSDDSAHVFDSTNLALASDHQAKAFDSTTLVVVAEDRYHAGKNVYLPVFCFEGLITEFPKITYRFPSLRASFSSQVKMSETGFIPGVPFLSQVKILYFYIF